MNIKEAIQEFVYFLHVEKNYSIKTIETYNESLKLFASYVMKKESIEDVTVDSIAADLVKRYIVYMKNELGNKPRTINTKLSALKSFYGFLVEKGYISHTQNVMHEIKQQKIPKTLPVFLTADEAEYFLLGIKLLSDNAVRDYAIFTLFLLSGARLSELVTLTMDQVNFKTHTITFQGKGSKERTVPLLERAEEALKEYISNKKVIITEKCSRSEKTIENKALRGRRPTVETDIVFLNKYGKPFSQRGIQDLFKRLTTKIGVYKKGLSVHKLRHTCFTLLYSAKVDLLTIKAIAGHENIKTTEIYTHIDNTNMHEQMKMHPLNNKSYDSLLIQRIKESIANKHL